MAASKSPRRGPRGAYKKSARTRQAILDAGLEVFAHSGYRSGSLRAIADRVSMSEAGMLHHFPNKGALLAAVLETRDKYNAALTDLSAKDGRELLRGLILMAQESARTPGVIELFTAVSAEATSADHPAHEYFADRYRTIRGRLTHALREIDTAGGLREGVDPQAGAISTLALWDGLQIQWLHEPELFDVADELRRHFNSLLREPL